MARPIELNDEVQKTICDAIRESGVQEAATSRAGISRATLAHWLARGREGEAPFAAFLDAYERARDEYLTNASNLLRDSANELREEALDAKGNVRELRKAGDARGLMWLLERMSPERFNPNSKVFQVRALFAELERAGFALTRDQALRLIMGLCGVESQKAESIAGKAKVLDKLTPESRADILRVAAQNGHAKPQEPTPS